MGRGGLRSSPPLPVFFWRCRPGSGGGRGHLLRDAVDAARRRRRHGAGHADDLAVGDDRAQELQGGLVVARACRRHDQPAVCEVAVDVGLDDVARRPPRRAGSARRSRRPRSRVRGRRSSRDAGGSRGSSRSRGAAGRAPCAARTRPGPAKKATPSTWPSVSGSSSRPRPDLEPDDLRDAQVVLEVSLISSWVNPGLRLGCSRQLSVVTSVPSPSTVIDPPSSTIGAANRSHAEMLAEALADPGVDVVGQVLARPRS